MHQGRKSAEPQEDNQCLYPLSRYEHTEEAYDVRDGSDTRSCAELDHFHGKNEPKDETEDKAADRDADRLEDAEAPAVGVAVLGVVRHDLLTLKFTYGVFRLKSADEISRYVAEFFCLEGFRFGFVSNIRGVRRGGVAVYDGVFVFDLHLDGLYVLRVDVGVGDFYRKRVVLVIDLILVFFQRF